MRLHQILQVIGKKALQQIQLPVAFSKMAFLDF